MLLRPLAQGLAEGGGVAVVLLRWAGDKEKSPPAKALYGSRQLTQRAGAKNHFLREGDVMKSSHTDITDINYLNLL